MTKAHKKKLIEVALPLEAINAASAREKSIRHGHPSTLHLWWARRPLAACRAVLFAQLVDDPSEYVDQLLKDLKIREAAEKELTERTELWEKRQAEPESPAANTPKPTLEDCAADVERKRLFQIIEDLVKWENLTNEEVLERARTEIRRSCNGKLPPIYDPFSGGGSIPLEAQRLGLPAYGSDLNPVAVMIGKAMIEIPPKFKDMEPIHPGGKERNHYRNAEGLAEDVRYYGEWMRENAWEHIGHLYPKVELPSEYGGGKGTVVAWIWARTVASPDPAFREVQVPLVSSFLLTPMKGKEAYVEPIVKGKDYRFEVRNEPIPDLEKVKAGTKAGRGSNFICLISGAAITGDYIKSEGQAGRMGAKLMAIVAEGKNGRYYLSPSEEHEKIATNIKPDWQPPGEVPARLTGGTCVPYGLREWADIFTARQILALDTFSQLVSKAKDEAQANALAAFSGIEDAEVNAEEYAKGIAVFLGFLVSKLADKGSTLCTWDAGPASNRTASGRSARVATVRVTFGRQALPMTWDFAEVNFFSSSVGSMQTVLKTLSAPLLYAPCLGALGEISQHDAQTQNIGSGKVLSTDPPYYDNIAYADLSDFFYVWLRRSLGSLFPEALSTIATPKSEELVASAYRHGGRENAETFFLDGMKSVVGNLASQGSTDFPSTIYYAFKQSEVSSEGISSTGWATFLEAIVDEGFSVVGTWPLRTEMASRMIASGTNALANSVVLVCRKKETAAEVITRAEFIRLLKRELPPAIAELQAANIAPADMPQSAIGPGIGVFSRYKAVLEADDSPMTVKTALQLINHELDEYLGGIVGEFDADTRFAITWFEQNGMRAGEYGTANNIATARGVSVESVKHAGIVESAAGKVRILGRDELEADWDPANDSHLTVWECLQYLVRQHQEDGISYDTALLLRKIGDKADAVKDLAYCLYDISANKRQDAREATAYNALIADWTELTREAAAIQDIRGDGQTSMSF